MYTRLTSQVHNDGIFRSEQNCQDEFLGKYDSDSNVYQQIANPFHPTPRTNGNLVVALVFFCRIMYEKHWRQNTFNAVEYQYNFTFRSYLCQCVSTLILTEYD